MDVKGLVRFVPIVAAVLLTQCQSPVPSVGPDPPDPPDPPSQERIVFVVDHPGTPNGSERRIRDRIRALGIPIVLVDDDAFVPSDTVRCRMVLMSKTVEDSLMGDKLKGCPCGVLFWEENQQMLRMLATVDNDGSDGAFWHTLGQRIRLSPDAPAALLQGLSGSIPFYTQVGEISYGKRQDVPASATVVAELEAASSHRVIYFYDRGDSLADGTLAAGRRFYFGLHRDTFHLLSPEALQLFDAGVRWTLEE